MHAAIGDLFGTTAEMFALMTPPAAARAFSGGTRDCDAARTKTTALRTAGPLSASVATHMMYTGAAALMR